MLIILYCFASHIYYFRLEIYNKTIIGFSFCDIQNYQCLDKWYNSYLRHWSFCISQKWNHKKNTVILCRLLPLNNIIYFLVPGISCNTKYQHDAKCLVGLTLHMQLLFHVLVCRYIVLTTEKLKFWYKTIECFFSTGYFTCCMKIMDLFFACEVIKYS